MRRRRPSAGRSRTATVARDRRIAGNDVMGLGVLDLGPESPAARSGDRACDHAGVDDVGRLAATLQESSGRLIMWPKRWFITARRPSERNIHSRAACCSGPYRTAWPAQPSLFARHEGLDEDPLQIGRDMFQRHEEQDAERRHAQVIRAAVDRESHCKRSQASRIWTWNIQGRP